jgi:hypothetical protein
VNDSLDFSFIITSKSKFCLDYEFNIKIWIFLTEKGLILSMKVKIDFQTYSIVNFVKSYLE